jgi:hypothetical protein
MEGDKRKRGIKNKEKIGRRMKIRKELFILSSASICTVSMYFSSLAISMLTYYHVLVTRHGIWIGNWIR